MTREVEKTDESMLSDGGQVRHNPCYNIAAMSN